MNFGFSFTIMLKSQPIGLSEGNHCKNKSICDYLSIIIIYVCIWLSKPEYGIYWYHYKKIKEKENKNKI